MLALLSFLPEQHISSKDNSSYEEEQTNKKYLWKRRKRKARNEKILLDLYTKIGITKSEFLGETILYLKLPMYQNEFQRLPQEQKEWMFEQLEMQHEMTIDGLVYLPNENGPRQQYENLNILKLILIRYMYDQLLQQNNLQEKQVHLCLIDSGSNWTFMVVDQLIESINYLTILSNRVGELQSFVDTIYQEYGLSVELLSMEELHQQKDIDVVIDCSKDIFEFNKLFKDSVLILDLDTTLSKLQHFYSRKNKQKLYYNLSVVARGQAVDPELLSLWLQYDYPRLKSVIEHQQCISRQETMHIITCYQIEIKEVIGIYG